MTLDLDGYINIGKLLVILLVVIVVSIFWVLVGWWAFKIYKHFKKGGGKHG